MAVTTNLNSNTKRYGKITEITQSNKLKSTEYVSSRILRPLGSIVLPFKIKKASLALRIEPRSLLENIFSIGINCMSLEMLWGEERKCSATVVGLDLVLALSKVRRCS